MQNFSQIEQNIKVSELPARAGNLLTPVFSESKALTNFILSVS